MIPRSSNLARRFLDANEALIDFVAGLSDEQWRAACPREGRTVGEVVLHIAAGHRIIGGITQAIAMGAPLPPAARRTVETGARFNARQTLSFAGRTRDDRLRRLRQNGRACAAMIEQLTDDELDRTVSTEGGPLSAEAEIEGGVLGHVDRHLTAVRETVAPGPDASSPGAQ
ncbi:MAG: DinB family protein [Candidatus Limnocylindrales bacterium]